MNNSEFIYRAYDIRGIADDEITEQTVYLIGYAFAQKIISLGDDKLFVGNDCRLSSPKFFKALVQGINDAGISQVFYLGEVPTALIYFAVFTQEVLNGVMITASHNPNQYNGFKMVIQQRPVTSQFIQELKQMVNELEKTIDYQPVEQLNYTSASQIVQEYQKRITQTITLARPLKIVVDAGNAMAGVLAPAIYKKLSCEVIELFCEIDGNFPNHHPDPSNPKNLKTLIEKIKEHNADLGIAFDGDVDRLGVVTDKGEIISSDRLLMLLSQELLKTIPNSKIVYDIQCSMLLPEIIEQNNGIPLVSKTGHTFIKQKIHQEKALLGGEMSGHIFYQNRWFGFDDGIYTGARLLEILSHKQEKSSQIFSQFPQYKTKHFELTVADEKKFNIMNTLIQEKQKWQAKELIFIDGLKAVYENGWGLIRPSNTTPKLIFRFEAKTQYDLTNIINIFDAIINPFDLKLDYA